MSCCGGLGYDERSHYSYRALMLCVHGLVFYRPPFFPDLEEVFVVF